MEATPSHLDTSSDRNESEDGGHLSRRTTLQMVLRLTALLGLAWAGTHTLVGHQASLAAGFTKGTVDINASRPSAAFSASDLTPGDVWYEELTVSNPGSLDLRYTLTTRATNPDGKNLAGQLDAEARKVSGTCDASSFAESSDTIVASSKLDVLARARGRMLAAGTSETACFRVSMPAGLGNSYQDATTSATFKIDAIQAVANS